MLTLVRRQPQQPRARFAPRSSPRFARRAPASPAQARGSPFADALTGLCTVLCTSASATAPTSAHCRSRCSRHSCGRSCGARPHFARHCPAQCAPHRPPLNRRGGSDPPGSAGVDLPIFHTAHESGYPTGRAGLGFHTRRSYSAGVPYGPMACPLGDLRPQTGSCGCWIERMSHRYTQILIALSPHGHDCPAPIHGRHAFEHEKTQTDTRAAYARTRHKHRPIHDRYARNSSTVDRYRRAFPIPDRGRRASIRAAPGLKIRRESPKESPSDAQSGSQNGAERRRSCPRNGPSRVRFREPNGAHT